MTQKKRIDRSLIRTRLAADDYLEFLQLADSRSIPQSQLAREAIVFYLRALQHERSIEIQEPLIRHVQSAVERICSMLAKIAIEDKAHSLYSVQMHGDEHVYSECRNKAVKLITRKVDHGERKATASLKEAILKDGEMLGVIQGLFE